MNLYSQLMNLVESTEGEFYFVDQEVQGIPYRIFGYRFASYSDWQKPGALESRGTVFNMKNPQEPKLVCRPFHKFFNLNENPFTQNLDMDNISILMEKMDGSLISFFWDEGIKGKSKMSFESPQAIQALDLLMYDRKLFGLVETWTKQGCTLNFEFTSPSNRVVVFYEKPSLTLLSVRDLDGNYVQMETLKEHFKDYLVDFQKISTLCVDEVLNLTDFEGYVVITKSGQWFKLKTLWYSSLHKVRDNLLNREKILEAVANDSYDDLISIATKEEKDLIDECFEIFKWFMKDSFKRIHDLHHLNKGKERKDFAISGTKEFPERYLFGIYMRTFNGFDEDSVYEELKEAFIKNTKEF